MLALWIVILFSSPWVLLVFVFAWINRADREFTSKWMHEHYLRKSGQR